MRLLAEIERTSGVGRKGAIVRRDAVRAIVRQGEQILMVYSTKHGDYHFPGGGVSFGETHLEALARELKEECGAKLVVVHGSFGKVVEYDYAKEAYFDLFCMTSYYYFCSIGPELGQLELEDYEVALGLEPCWVTVEEALRANKALLANGAPPWTRRETLVLELLTKAAPA
ncbi:MAG: NUDIX domain-containing protein [Limnochordia bacterium]|jgi:8-oxo-dGTP pyrophosphatase MutT (NUDIX family)